MDRKLDGIYFRIERDGKWQNICFSDLTEEEREKIGEDRPAGWWKQIAFHLADVLKTIGNEFDIIAGEEE